jgi:hypothetical protein
MLKTALMLAFGVSRCLDRACPEREDCRRWLERFDARDWRVLFRASLRPPEASQAERCPSRIPTPKGPVS